VDALEFVMRAFGLRVTVFFFFFFFSFLEGIKIFN
jgi:hypothetical protein